jgi:methylenetetrahydrofolate reductase (NADPH)
MVDAALIRPSRMPEKQGLRISFEFFPPKNDEGKAALTEAIERLAPVSPHFVSVTYGAGGSTREHTLATLAEIIKATELKAAGHLTCVSASRDEVDAVVRAYHDAGVRHIVALRGDPQGGIGARYEPHPEGYATTADLIKGIRAIGDFEISVSAYPEKHPESRDFDADLDVLQEKIDVGATRAITQFFFDNALYYRYRDRALARGISIPIVPGILPIQNFLQTSSFAMRTGASIPNWLAARFDGLDHDPSTRRLVSVTVASEQVFDLLDHGVSDFHFYTMNRAELTYAICHMLGLRTKSEQRAA